MRITWRPPRKDTSNVPPVSAEPDAGPHQPETPSVVRSAASTVSGEAVTAWVDTKLSGASASWPPST